MECDAPSCRCCVISSCHCLNGYNAKGGFQYSVEVEVEVQDKYTNPARGILDFCKQKFYQPLPCSPRPLYSMYNLCYGVRTLHSTPRTLHNHGNTLWTFCNTPRSLGNTPRKLRNTQDIVQYTQDIAQHTWDIAQHTWVIAHTPGSSY